MQISYKQTPSTHTRKTYLKIEKIVLKFESAHFISSIFSNESKRRSTFSLCVLCLFVSITLMWQLMSHDYYTKGY